ncbi:hypothetical protein [Lewinella sp. 4G2]|uniref:hypothetical protein n=1 Tax=Lewinella sp. 4G2 TaxID=1803372 RepID=UPI0007B48B77|nr:hypothetical protein [Lewinella sp. 4G2]OAV42753.1 hypothetical protein A3850_016065 [Lewinella sp. 4G2]
MISKYDNLLVGMLVAIAVALIGYALCVQGVESANQLFDISMQWRQRSLALIGICLNVIPMNYFRKKYWNKALRGLVIGTFLLAVAWFIYFGNDLLNGAAT